jgi:hypothetical protein
VQSQDYQCGVWQIGTESIGIGDRNHFIVEAIHNGGRLAKALQVGKPLQSNAPTLGMRPFGPERRPALKLDHDLRCAP